MSTVQGVTERGFESVREVFEAQFASGQHAGAAVAVYHGARKVVDLWGGVADEATGTPWQEGTMAVSYSTTKGLTATCVHVLAGRGLIDYEAPVAAYWPEFAAEGKGAVTVRQLMSHQAGLAPLPEGTASEQLLAWERMTSALAAMAPAWEPGTATGYHALTFGYLAGELVRRVSGKRLGAFLHDEVARPLGLERLHVGVPDALLADVAPLVSRMPEIDPEVRKQWEAGSTIGARAMAANVGGFEFMNTAAALQAEIPAINGAMTARDLARMYACLANDGELDGVRLMPEATVREMSRQLTARPDLVIMNLPLGWSMGYMTGGGVLAQAIGPRTTAFGHPGLGGSNGFADPEIGMSFGFTTNTLTMDMLGMSRGAELATAARQSIERVAA